MCTESNGCYSMRQVPMYLDNMCAHFQIFCHLHIIYNANLACLSHAFPTIKKGMILNNFVNQTKRFNFDKTSVTLPVQLVPAIYVLSKAEVILPNYSI